MMHLRQKRQAGFTLIELMMVVAIIGILAATALPMYQDYVVRAKISEAFIAGSSAKGYMSEAFQNGGVSGMTNAAIAFNDSRLKERTSKYIQDIQIVEGSPWTISIFIAATTENGIPIAFNGNIINFSPNVQGATPVPSSLGAIDWACTSETDGVAKIRGFGNRPIPAANALPAKFVPAECR